MCCSLNICIFLSGSGSVFQASFSIPLSPLREARTCPEYCWEDGDLLALGKELWIHSCLSSRRPPVTQGHITKKGICCPGGCSFASCWEKEEIQVPASSSFLEIFGPFTSLKDARISGGPTPSGLKYKTWSVQIHMYRPTPCKCGNEFPL